MDDTRDTGTGPAFEGTGDPAASEEVTETFARAAARQ
jgi:hypothetical protein